MSTSNCLNIALQYAERGWSVFPVHVDKRPLTAHGFKDCSRDPQQIKDWYAEHTDAGIGIATGDASGILVLDVDPRHGGNESLAKLIAQHGELPNTIESITGGGGRHLLFKHPGGVGNRSGFEPGLDVRGTGGYIVAPPSPHESGNLYQWREGHAPGEVELAEIPTWLLELIKPPAKVVGPNAANVDADVDGALSAMRRLNIADQNDGSKRLYVYCCKCREYGLSVAQCVAAIQLVAIDKPFTKVWSASDIQTRYEDAGKVVEDGSAITNPTLWSAEGRTDEANASRFVNKYGEQIRWCEQWGKWLIWTGKFWRKDETCEIDNLALRYAKSSWREAGKIIEDANAAEQLKKGVIAFCKTTNSSSGISNFLRLAKGISGITVSPEQLNANQWLFNVENGTINLHTGELQPHRQSDFITHGVPVNYDPAATCPVFIKFLNGIFAGNQNLIAFIQRYFGYCLTGDVGEQILVILWGDGSNGKTVLLNIIQHILSEYATTAPERLLTAKKWDSHPTEIAKLFGKRFVVANETDKNAKLSEARVKILTGGDRLTARGMGENFWDFVPTHKLMLLTNHKPRVEGTEHAMWRRLKLVPFTVQFWNRSKGESGEPELEADPQLIDKLKPEAAGILAWLVQGCLEWQRNGIGIPDEVLTATAEYRAAEDVLEAFLRECCIIDPKGEALSSSVNTVFADFSDEKIPNREWKRLMEAKGFVKKPITKGKYRNQKAWHGLRLKITDYLDPDLIADLENRGQLNEEEIKHDTTTN